MKGETVKPSCRPHRWQWPTPGDHALTCARCGRVLPFEGLQAYQLRGVIKAARRLHGREKGLNFAVVLTDALNFHENERTLTATASAGRYSPREGR